MTPTELWPGPTVGAKDVGEDRPEVLVVRQLINHFCQAAGRHFEEEGQVFGQAGVDQELGQGDGADLQHSEEPNTPPGFLKTKHTRHTDDGYNKITDDGYKRLTKTLEPERDHIGLISVIFHL